jgi:D-glycero-alpha-D-manno-heptose-7-phosphate kinase
MLKEAEVTDFAKRMRDIAYELKSMLLRGHLDRLGMLIHEAWTLKKTFAPGISNPQLDEIYDFARANGAAGGKLLGAGGGGYYFFYAERQRRHALSTALKARGFDVRMVHFVAHGLQSWTVRD